jgi:hypothetical protein
MAEIDIPIERFQRIAHHAMEQARVKREARRVEREARRIRNEQDGNQYLTLYFQQFELNLLMTELESQFEERKAAILEGHDIHEVLGFTHNLPFFLDAPSDIWRPFIERAKIEIASKVSVIEWLDSDDSTKISCAILMIDPPDELAN